jgi:hypothetical protein
MHSEKASDSRVYGKPAWTDLGHGRIDSLFVYVTPFTITSFLTRAPLCLVADAGVDNPEQAGGRVAGGAVPNVLVLQRLSTVKGRGLRAAAVHPTLAELHSLSLLYVYECNQMLVTHKCLNTYHQRGGTHATLNRPVA